VKTPPVISLLVVATDCITVVVDKQAIVFIHTLYGMVDDDINCFLTAALQGIMLGHAGDERGVGRGHRGGVRIYACIPTQIRKMGC